MRTRQKQKCAPLAWNTSKTLEGWYTPVKRDRKLADWNVSSVALEFGNASEAFRKIPGLTDARCLSSVGLGFGTRIGKTQLFPTPALDMNLSPIYQGRPKHNQNHNFPKKDCVWCHITTPALDKNRFPQHYRIFLTFQRIPKGTWNDDSHEATQNLMLLWQRLLSFWVVISRLLARNCCSLVVVVSAKVTSQWRSGGGLAISRLLPPWDPRSLTWNIQQKKNT